jgi:tetratricopeptide (TPR) repeat protein
VAWGALTARASIAVVALLIAAWCAISLRSSRLEEDGTQIARRYALAGLAGARPDAAGRRELARAAEDLERAAWLNPDPRPRVYRASSLFLLGESDRAAELAREVVESEPDNLEAWTLIAYASRGRAPGLAAEAARAIARLNPQASAERRERPR